MIGKRLLKQDMVSLADVKEIIEKRKKEGELTYEQDLTLEYCKKFSKLSKKDSAALTEELSKLNNVGDRYAVVIADILPQNADELRLIFSREHFILSEEEIKNILSIVEKYRK